MLTVLVADDDAQIRMFVRLALERSGYSVLEARDGAEALELVKHHRVAVVVADMVMPRIGGRELVWQLSQAAPHIPVILVSGILASNPLEPELLPPAAFLSKPFALADLVEAVGDVLR